MLSDVIPAVIKVLKKRKKGTSLDQVYDLIKQHGHGHSAEDYHFEVESLLESGTLSEVIRYWFYIFLFISMS